MSGDLKYSVRRALAWSVAGNFTLRFGILLVGIVLARLLTPDEFGVYAIALALQTLLQTLATVGLGAALVRSEDPERLAPTVATIALLAGVVLFGAMALSAHRAADLVGVTEAGPVIAVLSFTMVLSGLAAVPLSLLTRGFEQKKLFGVSAVDFAVSTVCSIGLVLLGLGPMALAISRLVSQSCATLMIFVLAKRRPRFGFDITVAGPALRFGFPAAAAGFLSVALINIDNVVIARIAGSAALGFYALAFNISNWPMSALGQGIKFVSLAAFSESARRRGARDAVDRDSGLAVGVTFAWAAALPAGVSLAVLSVPLIHFLYGGRWAQSAPVLAALGIFGALRVVFMLFDDYLLAHESARSVMWLQLLWIITLTPAMVFGTYHFGIAGGGWSHVIICVLVMLPVYLLAAYRAGADLRAVVRALIPPILAAVPAWFVAHWVSMQFERPVLAVVCGGGAAIVVYAGLLCRWLVRAWHAVHHDDAASV